MFVDDVPLNHNDMEWIYDFVHEVVFYEVYESDMAEDYEWVTDRDFAEIVQRGNGSRLR